MELKDIKKIIEQYKETEFYKNIEVGQRYYDGENITIEERRKLCFIKQTLKDDPYKANHKLKSLHTPLLVDQVVNYLLGKGVTWQTDQDTTELMATLGKRFDWELRKWTTKAGACGMAWVMPYISNGLKFKLIPTEQCIPVYEDDELKAVIREYKLYGDDVIEVYTPTTLFRIADGTVQELGHFSYVASTTTQEVRTSGSWDRIPLIPLKYNDDAKNQAINIRSWVDIYDITVSDFANNIDDFQDVYWILKNYNGQDLDEFMDDLKVNRAMKVGEGGDAKAETIQIPTEARTKFLDIVNTNIFKFGMGVDADALGDGSITNVVIRSRYAQLDLKANALQGQIEIFLEELLYFVNKYHEMTHKTVYEDVTPVFDRSFIINEQEKLETMVKMGLRTSQQTLIENNPLVTDVDQEIENLEQEAYDNPLRIEVDADVEPMG